MAARLWRKAEHEELTGMRFLSGVMKMFWNFLWQLLLQSYEYTHPTLVETVNSRLCEVYLHKNMWKSEDWLYRAEVTHTSSLCLFFFNSKGQSQVRAELPSNRLPLLRTTSGEGHWWHPLWSEWHSHLCIGTVQGKCHWAWESVVRVFNLWLMVL